MAKNQNSEATGDSASPTEVVEAALANCSGGLVELPSPEGVTYKTYGCVLCHQVLHVGLEDLEENGLPGEHAPLGV